MDESEIRQYIDLAHDDLVAAKDNLAMGHLRVAVSRAYYAMFYAATAVLGSRGLWRSKHQGIIAAFHKDVTMSQADLPAPIAAAIQEYVDELTHRFGGQLVDIMLFGSQARGQATRESDIDIMVVLDHPAARDLSEARGIAFDVWLTHGVLLSIRAFSRQSWRELEGMNSLFYRNVMHDRLSLFHVAV